MTLTEQAKEWAAELQDKGIVRIPDNNSLLSMIWKECGNARLSSFRDDTPGQVMILHSYDQKLLNEE